MIIAGIDPGKTGALAVDYGDGVIQVWDVPRAKVNGKDKPLWSEWSRSWTSALEFARPELIVIELVAAMPGQGVTSMFSFGRSLGFAHAIASGCSARIEFVTPSVWKGKLGLLNSDKGASREKFRILFPRSAGDVTRVKDDGRAEAGLLAYYGRKYL